jgi:hypothetical protein
MSSAYATCGSASDPERHRQDAILADEGPRATWFGIIEPRPPVGPSARSFPRQGKEPAAAPLATVSFLLDGIDAGGEVDLARRFP